MNKLFLLMAAVSLLCLGGIAQADVIALWDYNDEDIIVDQGAGTQSLEPTAAFNSYWEGDANPSSDPVSPGHCYVTKDLKPAGSGLSWAVSTGGYSNILVSLDIRRMGAAAPDNWTWAYDLGAGWVDYTDVSVTSQTWEQESIDLSSIAGANNNPSFRVKFVNRITETGAANVSWDYVKVSGNPVPEPSSLMALGAGLLGLAGSITRRKTR